MIPWVSEKDDLSSTIDLEFENTTLDVGCYHQLVFSPCGNKIDTFKKP